MGRTLLLALATLALLATGCPEPDPSDDDDDDGDDDGADDDAGDDDAGDDDAGDDDSGDDDTVESGWTELKPSGDSRIVYVSSSTGDDGNDGLGEKTPVATLEHGVSLLRDGYPDWLLLARGDRWDETFGTWELSGRSSSEPMVIGAYGTGERPYVNLVDRNGIFTYGTRVEHLAITDLHFHRDAADPALTGTPVMEQEQAAIYWLSDGEDILIEGCEFAYTSVAFNAVSGDGLVQDVRFRRNVVHDSWGVADSFHAQGLYASHVRGLLIEDNVMDHNGWQPGIAGAEPTIYNHNFYLQYHTFEVQLRGNVIARGSSHGAQMRNSGVCEGNLFVGNSIAVFLHVNDLAYGTQLQHVRDNAIVECGMQTLHPDGWSRGWGLDVHDLADASETILRDNVVAHCPDGSNAWDVEPGGDEAGNVIWDWGGVSDPGPFSDTSCTVGGYDATLGGAGTLESFLAEARTMARGNYREEYTAAAVVQYFQDCFSAP